MMLLLLLLKRVWVCASSVVRHVDWGAVLCVLSIAFCNVSAQYVAPIGRTETVGGLRAGDGRGIDFRAAPEVAQAADHIMSLPGASRQPERGTSTSTAPIEDLDFPASDRHTQQHPMAPQSQVWVSSLPKGMDEKTSPSGIQHAKMVTTYLRDLPLDTLKLSATDAVKSLREHKQQGNCRQRQTQLDFSTQSQRCVAQARKSPAEGKRSHQATLDNNLIIKWNMSCLESLPARLKRIQDTLDDVEKEELEVPLFTERKATEPFWKTTNQSIYTMQGPLIFRKGVFHRDTLSTQKSRDASSTEQLGRSYALSVLADALRARVRYPISSLSSTVFTTCRNGSKPGRRLATRDTQNGRSCCGAACRKELEELFLSSSVETLQATLYPSFGVDVLTFTNLQRVMQNVEAQDASALAKYVRASNSAVNKKGPTKLVEAGQCVEGLSFDGAGTLQGKTFFSVLDNLLGDPEYIKQWHHMSRLSNYSLWADAAWDEIPVSASEPEAEATVVALIDSGCYQHEDYWTSDTDNLLWRNRGETDCSDNIDNDGNGYVDDCWGWDFITGTNNVFPDYTSHGTSLASLLVAKHNDGKGGAGVMKFGKVMCLRAATQGMIYLSTLVGAFDYALRNGARISVHAYAFGTSMVQGYMNLMENSCVLDSSCREDSHLKTLFESAYEQDHLAVVSAGSQMCDLEETSQCTIYPAGYRIPSILVVGSSNLAGGPCCGTNWGKKAVHVFAAGSRIYAGNCINHKDHERLNCGNCYAFMYGSSISAGLTAGVAAMVWAYMQKTNPVGWRASTDKESMRLKKALIYSSMPSARIAGACLANGVLNMHRALHYYDRIPAENFVPRYKDLPSLFRWRFPPFFQGKGATTVTVGSAAAA